MMGSGSSLEILGTYDVLFVSDGIHRKNEKIWWVAGCCNILSPGLSFYALHTDNEDLFHTWCIHLLTLMLLLLYLSVLLDDIMDSYLPACGILPSVFWVDYYYWDLRRWLIFFFTWSILVCLQDDEDLFQTYVIATTGGSSALQDDVMDSYATCLWNLIVFILGGLLLLRAMPITSTHSREMELNCPAGH